MAFALRKTFPAQVPIGKATRRAENQGYLDFVRGLPCIVTGRSDVEAAHISYADNRYGKVGRGRGAKESDCWAIPLCAEEHRKQHSGSERAYWSAVGIDPCIVAMAIYAAYPNRERALLAIRNIEAGKAVIEKETR